MLLGLEPPLTLKGGSSAFDRCRSFTGRGAKAHDSGPRLARDPLNLRTSGIRDQDDAYHRTAAQSSFRGEKHVVAWVGFRVDSLEESGINRLAA
jgi:hypothetical protein